MGGLSGTGKTTIARALAPHVGGACGALHVRSDVERKRLAAVGPLQPLPPEAYIAAAAEDTCAAVLKRAAAALDAGQSVIVDAVFAREDERRAVEDLASSTGVEVIGIWLEAPFDIRLARVAARRDDASDADAAVVRAQAGRDIGRIGWQVVTSQGGLDATLARVRARLGAAVATC